MKKIIPQILAFILWAAVVWWAITHQRPPESTEKEKEKEYIQQVNQKQAEIKRLQARYDSIVLIMYNDSLEFTARLNQSEAQIKRLKLNARKIDLKNANPDRLDSIVQKLYPGR